MDVIHAAKMISECGSKLNKLAKDIAAQVNQKELNKTFIYACSFSVLNLNQNQTWLLMLIVRDRLLFLFEIEIYSSSSRHYSLLPPIGYNQQGQSRRTKYQWRINRQWGKCLF